MGAVTEHRAPTDVLEVVQAARRRILARIEFLSATVATIVEGAEFTSTDDEHDPEGATIAYERAQAIALLRDARFELEAIDAATSRLERGERTVCRGCGRPVGLERLLALPTTEMCVRCAC